MNLDINTKALNWAKSSAIDETSRQEISELINQNNSTELNDRFYRDLEFGTGGLRGVLGAGSNRMNIYNIRKATQALADYLNEFHNSKTQLKVAVSFDSRRFSSEFAKAAAEVLAGNGIQVFMTKELRPVPMLSFMTRYYKCHAGICITASHNPPEYNGYKVYWQDGGQLVPPHDLKIIAKYNAINDYAAIRSLEFKLGLKSEKIIVVDEELDSAYFSELDKLQHDKSATKNLRVVYSALHGAGQFPVSRALKNFGFNDVHFVEEQSAPNGNFPTVKSPNPEDTPTMKLALELGVKVAADVILATDPDVDRLGAIVKHHHDFIVLNGNQIASLLTDYILKKSSALDLKDGLVIKTIVTSDLLSAIARSYGVETKETLTGFKWIAELIEKLESGQDKPYKKFLCGGEESYGFLTGRFVRDKDAVSSAAIFCEMASSYKEQGLSVIDALDNIYQQHGVFAESLHTITLKGQDGLAKINAIMQNLRLHPPQKICGSEIAALIDFQEQKLTRFNNSETLNIPTELPSLPKSDVLQIFLLDGSKISIRPSGTEPKLKFYFATYEKVTKELSAAEAKVLTKKRLSTMQASFEDKLSS
ncbi:MAG: phospho-sugar mutase [Oligoflexales bacterium]|nr:phospho-sugar mutase [Oligoflexales bacterium]